MQLEDTPLDQIDASEEVKPNRITIPYKPRKHFIPLHTSPKRWKFSVAHRRAGKSVSQINEIIKRALQNNRPYPPPRYAYVGPSFAQTKDLIWGYAKHYTSPLGPKVNEGDLQLILPQNGAMINLYGGAGAYERMRGLYFDGIVLDEYPLLNPAVFSTVVRPCLADYRGWAIVSGTSNGDDHFHALKKKHENDPAWDIFIIPVTETDALHPDEVREMTEDMSPEEYAREMLCRFDAPIEGAYFAKLMNDAEAAGRITGVPHDPAAQVFTWWDLGIDDFMAIWYIQKVGGELHIIDHDEFSGEGLPYALRRVRGQEAGTEHRRNWIYSAHVMPHDIKARELGTGKSRYEIVTGLLPDSEHVFVASPLKKEDQIEAAKSIIPLCYFDKIKTAGGVSALRNYHKNVKTGKPVHNWASHSSDGFQTGAISISQTIGYVSSSNVHSLRRGGALRKRIRGIV